MFLPQNYILGPFILILEKSLGGGTRAAKQQEIVRASLSIGDNAGTNLVCCCEDEGPSSSEMVLFLGKRLGTMSH